MDRVVTHKRTGIPGLDDVLIDGMPLNRVTLVKGPPGSGKTTFGLQFLVEGVRQGAAGIYITLADTKPEIEAFAASHGMKLEGISILEMLPPEYLKGESQSFFRASEIEIAGLSKRILDEAERLRPSRLVIDSLSELRLSMADETRFRRQITAIKHVMTKLGVTTVMLEPSGGSEVDLHLETVTHAVIELDVAPRTYGRERRRLRVVKMREFRYVPGYHDYELTRTGLRIYPRVVTVPDTQPSGTTEIISSGIAEFDALVGGGLKRGSTTLLTGTTGTGKSTLVTQYAIAAAARGERSHFYMFDENVETFVLRGQGLGLPVLDAMRDGLIRGEELNPAELSPGEFAVKVRTVVEEEHCRMVVFDSLTGYMNALPEERSLLLQMHEMGAYLKQRKVATFMILAQPGVMGSGTKPDVDLSYLADTVIQFRSFEAMGSVRTALSVVKKRYGVHERTIRELLLEPGHIRVGPVLRDFQGVLTGEPQFIGGTGAGTALLQKTEKDASER